MLPKFSFEELKNIDLNFFLFFFKILTRLLQLYAEEESLPSTSTSNEQTKSAKEARATLIANLWIEMQNYGLPPPEITSENNSASSTLNECSII